MSGAKIEFDDAALRQALQRLQDHIGDLSPVMKGIGAHLESATELRFDRGEGPGGIDWTPSLRAAEEGGQTLVDTGRLRDSITNRSGPDFAEAGTNVLYAAIHQFGGTVHQEERTQSLYYRQYKDGHIGNLFVKKGRSNFAQDVTVGAHDIDITARPFLGFDDTDDTAILEIIENHLKGLWGGS